MAETTLIISAIGAFTSIMAAVVSGRYASKSARAQIHVAEINSEKDVIIQREKFEYEALTNYKKNLLEKLQQVHETTSMISANYSQTRSHIDWTDNADRAEFRRLYYNDRVTMQKASSTIAVYLSDYVNYQQDITASLDRIYGQMNLFWFHQEELLRNECVETSQRESHKRNCVVELITASNLIASSADIIRRDIAELAISVNQLVVSSK